MSFEKIFYIDTVNRWLVKGFTDARQETDPRFTQNDITPIKVILLEPTDNVNTPFRNIEVTTETLRVAVGRIDKAPKAGTFTLTFDGNTTQPIDFDATATDIQTELNNLASITSAGGVVVTDSVANSWQVGFNNVGARNEITADVTLIEPLAQFTNSVKFEGDGSTKEVQILKIKENPVALQSSFSGITAPVITITELTAGAPGINELQRISIDQLCQGGTFAITFGGQVANIAYNSTAAQAQESLEALSSIGPGNVIVSRISETEYTVEFIGSLAETDHPLMTADASGLRGFSGFSSELDLSSTAVEALLDGEEDASVYFEIELNDNNKYSTLLRVNAILENDLIDFGSSTPPGSSNLTDWGNIPNANLNNMPEGTIKGRPAASGSGKPVDLIPSQVRAILGYITNVISVGVGGFSLIKQVSSGVVELFSLLGSTSINVTQTGNDELQFSVNFGGTGSDETAARSDHHHDTIYVRQDGSTPFTAEQLGVTSTSGAGLVTKDQMETAISGRTWRAPVLSRTATPPGSPNTGDRYIITATATGAWVGREDDIAEWNGSSWDFNTPEEGWTTWVDDEDKQYSYNATGGSWVGGAGGTSDHGALTGLGDDDHLQYHTDTRALTWLGTRTSDDLPEGATNKYLTTAERALINDGLTTINNTPTGSYTLVSTDTTKHVEIDSGLTIPTGLPIGFNCAVGLNNGTKQPLTTTGLTVLGDAEANISPDGVITLLIVATNTVRIGGQTEA